MKKTKLRMLALLLTVVMTVGLLPAAAISADPPQQAAEEQSVPEAPQPDTTVPETLPSEATSETTASTEPAAPDPTQEANTAPTESAPTTPPTEQPAETEPQPTETEPAPTETSSPEAPAEPPIMGPVPHGRVRRSAVSGFNGVWMQGYVYRVNEDASNFKHTYTLKDGSHTIDLDHLYVMRLRVDGRYKTAYCLEPDTPVDSGEDYGDGSNAGIAVDWNTSLDWKQQKAIGLALLYSDLKHPDKLESIESVEWEVATQIIIWEIVMGMRNPAAPYNRTNSALFDQFNGTIRYNDGDDHYLTGVKAKYDSISGDMAIHEVIPSFTAPYPRTAPTHTMKRQPDGSYAVSLTDSNGILSRYPFSSQSPVTISQSGSSLTATAPAGAAWGDLSFTASRSIPNPENPACLFRIFHLGGNNQDMIVSPNDAPYDPVPAYFNLAKQQSPGKAVIRKTSSNSDDVQGYCFKLYNWDSRTSWYGKTDASGNMYETDSSYNVKTGTYEFTGLFDGEYAFKEVLSVKGIGKVFPSSIRLTVTNKDNVTTFDKTYSGQNLRKDDFGDACPIDSRIHLTGLTDGGTLTITVNNEQLDGYIEVHKVDENGKALAGAEFTLTNTATNKKYHLGPTNKSGYAKSSNLPIGTYSIEETVVPTGYVKHSMPKTITLTPSAPNRTVSFTAVNKRIIGHIRLTKTDSETGKSLRGAVFQITFPDGKKVNMTEDANGVHSIKNLRYGTYKVREIKAPEGYLLNPTVYTVNIRENGKTYSVTTNGKVPNTPIKGHIRLTKTSVDTGASLKGAVFQVTFPDGKKVNMTEGANGVHSIKNLRYGTYKVREIKAPEGYLLNPTVYTVNIRENGKTYSVTTNEKVPNTPIKGHIRLTKTDSETGKGLRGAVFQVTFPDGTTQNMTEGANGVHSIKNLRYGTYKVQEIKAPAGYVLDETIYTVKITENGKTYFVTTNGKVPNRVIRGNIQLTKVDSTDGKPLTGAVFQVTFPDGKKVNMTEDANGVHSIKNLRYGTYKVREIKAPEGFQPDPTVYTVDITENDKTYIVQSDGYEGFANTPVPGSISVQKTDTHGNTMEGVTFLLEYSLDDGGTWEPVISRKDTEPLIPGTSSTQGIVDGKLTTDANGKITFAGLRINSQTGNIRYRLTEIAATDGHTLLAGTAFNGCLTADKPVDVQITATNGTSFELPVSGSHDLQNITIAGAVLILMAALIPVFIKKEEKNNEK